MGGPAHTRARGLVRIWHLPPKQAVKGSNPFAPALTHSTPEHVILDAAVASGRGDLGLGLKNNRQAVAVAHVQDNDPEFAHGVVSRAGVRAQPDDIGISRAAFVDNLVGLRAYSHAEGLDVGVADLSDITVDEANQAFDFAATLPRQ